MIEGQDVTDLFDKITENEKVAHAAVNTFDAGYRKAWADMRKSKRARQDFEKSMIPFWFGLLLLFGSGIIGAIFYGIGARNGWLDIIGVCLP
jgi:hypothetical protein